MLHYLKIAGQVALGLIVSVASVEVAVTAQKVRADGAKTVAALEKIAAEHAGIARYAATSADGSVIYLGSGASLLRSTNGGLAFTRLLPPPEPAPPPGGAARREACGAAIVLEPGRARVERAADRSVAEVGREAMAPMRSPYAQGREVD